MDAVVMAAGEGRRMRPLTGERPKVMLPVAGRPILEHVLVAARAAGATHAHLVVQYRRDVVEAHFGDGRALGLRITYHDQGAARGTGHALAAVRPAPKEPFLLLSGDTIVEASDLVRLVAEGTRRGTSVMGVARVADPRPYGAVEAKGDRLVRIHEKSPQPPSDWVNTGMYWLTPKVADAAAALTASPRGELELTDAVQHVAGTEGVHVVPLSSWRDVGRPWHLLDVNEAMLAARAKDAAFWVREGHVEPGVTLVGPVRIERGAHVKAGTYIEGPVVIQEGARVGPMAYLRAHSVIGPRCHVGAHTEIKNSILLSDANAPHLNYVGDSILGSNVNLGAGTKVANLRHDGAEVFVAVGPSERVGSGRRKMGVVVGDRVKTGINASLDCGTVVGVGALLMPGGSYHGYLEGGALHAPGAKARPLARETRGV